MGITLIVKNADFSGVAVDYLKIETSVKFGLLSLFETRLNAAKAADNAGSGADGAIIGAPTYSIGSGVFSNANSVLFGSAPTKDQTILTVFKIKNGGVAVTDLVVGSPTANATTKGAVYFSHYNRRLDFVSTTFPLGAVPPLAGSTNRSAGHDFPAGDEGKFVMAAGILESNVSLRLYLPKTGTLYTSSAVGRDFSFDNQGSFRTAPGGTASFEVALFAHWNRPLSTTELNTVYAEIKPQLARFGIDI